MKSLLLAGLLLCLSSPAAAIEDFPTPRSMAMGGSLRSLSTAELGPLINPAGMPLFRRYVLNLSYGLTVQGLGSAVHLSIVDSITSKISAGLYYTFVNASPTMVLGAGNPPAEATRQGHETGMALGLPLGDRFSLGVTLKYLTVSTDIANPTGLEPKRIVLDSTTSAASADGFTFDVGAAARITEGLALGVVGHNLIPLRSIEAPIALGMGVSYQLGKSFLISYDAVIDFDRYHAPGHLDGEGKWIPGKGKTTVRTGGGLEYLIAEKVPIRAGYQYNSGIAGHYIGFGSGYGSPRFAIDLSYRLKVSGGNESIIVAGIRVFLQ